MMTKSTFYSITPGKLARIFLRIYVKINLNTVNNTSTKLSIDIFSVEFKTKLLRITVLELETLMLRMISSKIPFEDLLKRRHELFSNLILNVLEKIEPTQFEKMKACNIKTIKNSGTINFVLDECCNNFDIFFETINVQVNSSEWVFRNAESEDLLEALLDTITIRISNCVGYILLDMEPITTNNKMYSTREINKYRNILSKEFYLEKYIYKPKALYESKHLLWILSSRGIFCRYIYKRPDNKTKYWEEPINLTLEFVDFISPLFFDAINLLKRFIFFILEKILLEIAIFIKRLIVNITNI
uniref:Conserved protein n=1 Tax=Haptophyceae sp. NIES-3900 TaxID=2748608 RepID=A0A7R6WD56_9EUKA|nr:conserved protein [Haptophyceae sp. NIES-3900]